jgi:hypothetical protein
LSLRDDAKMVMPSLKLDVETKHHMEREGVASRSRGRLLVMR